MQLDGFENLFSPETFRLVLAVLLKVGIGAVCAGAIGYEREIHGRPAGIRTHILIVIGVVLFTEVSRAFLPDDGGRIAAQVVTGIGFLGAGSILRLGAEVKGLTSAASIWAVAAIGMAISQGGAFIWIAVIGAIATLFTLSVVDNLERRLIPFAHPRLAIVEIQEGAEPFAVMRNIKACGIDVHSVRFAARGLAPILEMDLVHLSPEALTRIAAIDGVARVSTS